MTEALNVTSDKKKKILMVGSNSAVSTTLGVPVGLWASELTHAYLEFRQKGYDITIASPEGGKLEFDALSDPRDPSGYSEEDLISLGFINSPKLMALLENSPSLENLDQKDFDSIVIIGGQGPMFTFPKEKRLHKLIAEFYEAEKPTAALCHGTSALLFAKLSNGKYLIEGETMTGFANSEEDYADHYVGKKVMPFRIEDEAKKLGANLITGGTFKEFAIRDGRLITGQQQYSGGATARLVIEALGT